MATPPESRLGVERNVWLATVRADGRPHLVPIWFVWHDERIWICTGGRSVKSRNLERDGRVTVSLEDGNRPVVGEGRASRTPRPYPRGVVDAFIAKFDWDLTAGDDDGGGPYDALWAIEIDRWVFPGPT